MYELNQPVVLQGRSLTHTENDDKTLVHFTWFPDEDYGPVQIV